MYPRIDKKRKLATDLILAFAQKPMQSCFSKLYFTVSYTQPVDHNHNRKPATREYLTKCN